MLNAVQVSPVIFGKTPTPKQLTELKEMVASFPELGEEVADRLTLEGVDYHKATITLPGQLKLVPGVVAGMFRGLRFIKQAQQRSNETAYHVQWLELPNTPAAQAWVHNYDTDATEGPNQITDWKDEGKKGPAYLSANYANNLFTIRRIEPK